MRTYYKAAQEKYLLDSSIDWMQQEYTKNLKYTATLYHYTSGGFFISKLVPVETTPDKKDLQII